MPVYQQDPASLNKLYVPGANGVQVPLGSIARFEHVTAPLSVAHQEQFPSVTISFNLAPHAALSDAVREVAAAERYIEMPSSITGTFSGDAAEFAKSLAGQPWLLLAAAVAIYIVLGVLYESFIHPFTILTTLPSAGVGALLALMLFGYDLSVIALIGIILLMGIVKKNAIMMIDFALEAERGLGMSPRDSIVQAALLRFRPIMMTTLAALFGAIPLAVESGTGSELRNPLGITIIGGLLLSQMLTLYTTPVIYLQMERLKQRWSRPRGFVPPERRSPAPGPGGVGDELLLPVHPQAGRHHAVGYWPAADRHRRLPLPAGGEHADHRVPDHPRVGEPARRRSGDHGGDGRRAAGAPPRRDRRRHRDHLDQFARQHQHHDPVRPQPQDRRRGARRAGGAQCRAH